MRIENLGVGDNMSGLVWVMESTSVLVIILRIPEKNKKQKTAKGNTGKRKRESRVTKDHSTK